MFIKTKNNYNLIINQLSVNYKGLLNYNEFMRKKCIKGMK